jgi:hypothetical protein
MTDFVRSCRGEGSYITRPMFTLCCRDEGGTHVSDLEQEVAMLATYVQNYGPFERERVKYWHFAAHLVDSCGWSVEQVNAWLTSGLHTADKARSRSQVACTLGA